jgi:hypothetical protein
VAETEYDDPKRIELLTALKEALNCDVTLTIWALLWLSDIDKLKKWVHRAQQESDVTHTSLIGVEITGNIVQRCEFMKFYIFLQC